MHIKISIGDTVRVYQDPFTCRDFEGWGKVLKISSVEHDGPTVLVGCLLRIGADKVHRAINSAAALDMDAYK